MANKIKYGLRNVYYSKITYTGNTAAYASPVAIPGAVNLSMDAQGELSPFYGDDIVFWQGASNNGYSGTLEVALLPDSFRKDILGETEDTNHVAFEFADGETNEFALLFEFQGDKNAVRHSFLRCVATRAAVTGSTKETSITPQTETLNITAMPRLSDECVKGRCDKATAPTQYASWFTTVYEPTLSS